MIYKLRKLIKIIIKFILFFILLLIILNVIFPLAVDKLYKSKSVMIYDRDGKLLRAYTSTDGMWRINASFASTPSVFIKSLIIFEDKNFYSHFGIDPLSFIRAMWLNINSGKIVSGFSTITMQLARMIEPKERTIWSKLIEMFRAIQMEFTFSKEEILEFYLNIAPYGGNIEGIASASYMYFGKPYTELSTGEIALLIGLPNSPTKYRPDINPERAKQQRNKILKILYEKNIISKSKYKEALLEPIPHKRYKMPFYAPHLSDYLKLNNEDKSEIYTTIDLSTQNLCETLLVKHIQTLKQKGIYNGAIIVIDNKTKEVLAFIGSGNYFDEDNQGQVNGGLALRSPGSALKPFVYVLAAEEGSIAYETMLVDLPEDFSGFEPKNYDKKYHGVIPASKALAYSLNIPAVKLLRNLKYKNLYNKLEKGGITSLKQPEEYYGLSLILGGVEVTLLELTTFYSTLASEGLYKKYTLLKNIENLNAIQLFTPEASYLISEMLANEHHLNYNINWKSSLGHHKIAWKTGTSYGHRDAWSIGYDKDYTVGVWIGNFDNRESPDIVGIKVATPLMFNIFKGITKETNPKWLTKPSGLGTRLVSPISGKIPNSYDTVVKEELYIKGVSNKEKCDIRQKILIDKETGYRLYYYCLENKEYEEKILTIWPGKVRTWMEQNGYPVDTIPKVHPDCRILFEDSGPKIDSPSDNSIYYLKNDLSAKEQQIILKAHPEKGNKKVYWFINNIPIGVSNVGENLIYKPEEGEHILTAMDEEGRTSKIKFYVLDISNANTD